MLGTSAEATPDSPEQWFRRVHPADLDPLKHALEALLTGREEVLRQEFRILHKDGNWRWFACHARASADLRRVGGSFTDVTREKNAEDRLLLEAFHDSLTELPNRTLLLDRMSLALSRSRHRTGTSLAVLYIDLDRTRTVNQSLGHEGGDAFLKQVSDRLKAILRPGDTLARVGGDKFAFLVEGISGPQAGLRFAEEIDRAVTAPLFLGGHEIVASASTGLGISDRRHRRAEDLLNDAISAMHKAKEAGTACELFDPEIGELAKDRLRLEADLRRALERDELQLYYQPIISFESGRLSSLEALLRWKHPERGFVSPDVFIPIAEENGLIIPIGSWVLEQACRQMAGWRSIFPGQPQIAVAVNLSARQFDSPTLVDEVANTLDRYALDASALKLEMTESVVMARTRENAARLQSLRDLGVQLLIDDFGTGYSSLSSLHTFPLDTLKIDRSFVSHMEFEEEKAEIVRTILTLARNLGMDVVAEGVETAAQINMLRSLECPHGQGYYFSSAVDHESASEWLRNSPTW